MRDVWNKYILVFSVHNLGGNADTLRPINLGRSFFTYKEIMKVGDDYGMKVRINRR